MSNSKVRRGSRTITTVQRARFVEHMGRTLNATASAKAAGFDRDSAYRLREKDPEFKAAWEHAVGEAIDRLHEVALDLATKGDGDYIVTKDGDVVMDPEAPGVPLRNWKRDSRVLMFLLTHYKPETFRPATHTEVTIIPADLQPDPVPTPDEPAPEKPIL